MVLGPLAADELESLAAHLRSQPTLRAKGEIGLVSEVLGRHGWVEGPGDDGAVIDLGHEESDADASVVVCGEALLPAFVARDPYGAGIAAVLTNVNDLAAMGATPLGIVDTVVGSADLARSALRGMRDAAAWYDVPLVGGHLTIHTATPALSAFGIGRVGAVLSSTRVAAGQSLVVAACVDGAMRADFPFFRSFDQRGHRMAGDIRLLPALAASGACVAAKDVSMAGLIGSLAMLLEWSGLGATVDLAALPRPPGVAVETWLTCFPAYAFLLCCPPERAAECVAEFRGRDLAATVVGVIDDSAEVAVQSAGRRAVVLDLSATAITGLAK
jgi:selenophosphate synthetase-related protein